MIFKNKNKKQEYINSLKNSKNIIIWGTSSAAEDYVDFIEKLGLSSLIKFAVDNDTKKVGQEFRGYKILSSTEAINYIFSKNYRVVVASMYIEEITQQLLENNISQELIDINGPFIVYEEKVLNGLFKKSKKKYVNALQLVQENIESFQSVYDELEDQKSREVYENILKSKVELDINKLASIYSQGELQYLDSQIISLEPNEVICDCGSYIGDTLETFLNSSISFEKYIAIEADSKNYNSLLEYIDQNKLRNIETHNVAVWDKKEILKFQNKGSESSQVITDGSISINADKLDNLLKDTPITFLKMDIEGAEENALLGAKKIIQRDKPILAICLYHSLEDLYKLPLFIKELNPDYHIFIRHYTPMFNTETVCYAIPTNRLINK